jgi:hypothetical protein
MAVSSLHCQSSCKCFYDLNGVSICLLHPSFQSITRALIISRNDIYFSVVFIISDFDLITILIQNVVNKLLKKVFYIIFTLFIEHMTCDLRKKKYQIISFTYKNIIKYELPLKQIYIYIYIYILITILIQTVVNKLLKKVFYFYIIFVY